MLDRASSIIKTSVFVFILLFVCLHPFTFTASAQNVMEIYTDIEEDGSLYATGDYMDYSIWAGDSDELDVEMWGPDDADFDLYVRFDALPDGENDDAVGNEAGSSEYCNIPSTNQGFYYITVYSYEGSGDFSLLATITENQAGNGDQGDGEEEAAEEEVELDIGVTHYDTLTELDTLDYFVVEINDGIKLTIELNGPDSADYDLYVKEGSRPTTEDYDTNAYTYSAHETCHVDNPFGTYYILVNQYEGFGDYTLEARILKDEEGPAVEIDSPSDGDMVSGTITVILEITDESEIAFGEFSIDSGEWVRNEPGAFEFQFDTTTIEDGSHFINARAEDIHGNLGEADPVEIMINNQQQNEGEAGELFDGQSKTSYLDAFNKQDIYFIEVDTGYQLDVVLDGPDNADFDLYVKEGEEPTTNSYDVNGYTASADERCSVEEPDGEYFILVNRYSGEGEYTITADILIDDSAPDIRISSHSDGMIVSGTVRIMLSINDQSDISMAEISIDEGSWISDTQAPYEFTWDTSVYTDSTTHTIIARATDIYGNTGETEIDLIVDNSIPDQNDKYALVIGISDYYYIGDLRYADSDAISWTNHLQSQGYSVKTIYNRQATRQEILDELDWLESMEEEGDHVAFVYAGHGGHFYEAGYSGSGSMIFASDATHNGRGCISDSELSDIFDNFDSEHIFIYFDSCRSGGMNELSGSGRLLITACDWNEWSYDAPEYGNGAWTYWFLIWGIEGQGYTSMEDSFMEAKARVMREYNLTPQIFDPSNDKFYL